MVKSCLLDHPPTLTVMPCRWPVLEGVTATLNMSSWTAIPPAVFHPDAPAFSPIILTRGLEWPDFPDRSETTHADQALTDYRRTCTPQNAPVLYTPAGREMCAGQSVSVLGQQSTMYKRFHIVNCHNRVLTRASTDLILITNMIENIKENKKPP